MACCEIVNFIVVSTEFMSRLFFGRPNLVGALAMSVTQKFSVVLLVGMFELIVSFAALERWGEGRFYVYASMCILLFLLLNISVAVLGRKEMLCSPAVLLSVVAMLFSIFGGGIFLIRDSYGIGMGGDPVEPAAFFRRFCYFFYFCSLIDFRDRSIGALGSFEFSVFANFQLKLVLIFALLCFGIYIATEGFSQVAILSENPDAVRYQNRGVSNVAVGSLFLLFGIHAFVIIVSLLEVKKISFFVFLVLFIVYYTPLVLSASRLLMMLPFVSLALIKIQYLKSLTGRRLVMVGAIVLAALSFAFIFGAYRSHGVLQDFSQVVSFLALDLFPEFSGVVFTQGLVDGCFVTPLATVISGIFPSKLLSMIGVDKFEHFQMVGAMVGELWNSNYSIRLSLIGELYFASAGQIFSFMLFLCLFVILLCFKIFVKPDRYRHIYVVTGVLVALSIPYGAVFLVITVQFFIFSMVFFKVIK